MFMCSLPCFFLDLYVGVLLDMFMCLDLHVGVSTAAFSLKERGSIPWPSGLGREKVELPPRLGLGTIK